jgi:hypothetical protein
MEDTINSNGNRCSNVVSVDVAIPALLAERSDSWRSAGSCKSESIIGNDSSISHGESVSEFS